MNFMAFTQKLLKTLKQRNFMAVLRWKDAHGQVHDLYDQYHLIPYTACTAERDRRMAASVLPNNKTDRWLGHLSLAMFNMVNSSLLLSIRNNLASDLKSMKSDGPCLLKYLFNKYSSMANTVIFQWELEIFMLKPEQFHWDIELYCKRIRELKTHLNASGVLVGALVTNNILQNLLRARNDQFRFRMISLHESFENNWSFAFNTILEKASSKYKQIVLAGSWLKRDKLTVKFTEKNQAAHQSLSGFQGGTNCLW